MKALPVGLLVAFVVWDYAVRVEAGTLLGERLGDGREVLRSFYASMGLAAALGLCVLAVAHLVARDPYRWLDGAPVTLAGFLYVWFVGAHWFPIREMGMGYIVALTAVVKVGDSGAFFVGSRWGRRRLAPRASPNKTVEGAVAGLVASVASGGLVALAFGLEGGVGFWVLFGLVVGAASQLGDLVASAIKRSAGAKDSGNLLPVLGGVLDIVDSLLLAAPVALWLLAW
jgi:phosphatidate cytidylyltransferase